MTVSYFKIRDLLGEASGSDYSGRKFYWHLTNPLVKANALEGSPLKLYFSYSQHEGIPSSWSLSFTDNSGVERILEVGYCSLKLTHLLSGLGIISYSPGKSKYSDSKKAKALKEPSNQNEEDIEQFIKLLHKKVSKVYKTNFDLLLTFNGKYWEFGNEYLECIGFGDTPEEAVKDFSNIFNVFIGYKEDELNSQKKELEEVYKIMENAE